VTVLWRIVEIEETSLTGSTHFALGDRQRVWITPGPRVFRNLLLVSSPGSLRGDRKKG